MSRGGLYGQNPGYGIEIIGYSGVLPPDRISNSQIAQEIVEAGGSLGEFGLDGSGMFEMTGIESRPRVSSEIDKKLPGLRLKRVRKQ